jgi:YggT family protein
MTAVLVNFIQMLAFVLWLLLIARVVLSWTNPMGGGGLVAFIYQVTEPILAPIRRILPPAGGMDWSPLVAMLLLGVILRLASGLRTLG